MTLFSDIALNNTMKFDDLYNLVVESGFNPSSPRSMGGNRMSTVKKNIGPMGVSSLQSGVASGGEVASPETSRGYSASSVGRSDNSEKPTPVDQMKKYLFDVSKADDRRDVYELEAENKKRMRNAFSLLFNSKDFYSNFKKILSDHLTTDTISFKDEKEWNRLKDEVDRRASNTTGLRDQLEIYQARYDDAINAENDIKSIQTHIQKLKNKKSKTADKETKASIQEDIESAEYDIMVKKSMIKGISSFKKEVDGARSKLVSETEAEMIAKDSLLELEEKIGSVTENNKKANDIIIRLIKKLINQKADGLLDRYKIENDVSDEEIDAKEADFLNIEKDLISKLKLLKELTTDDNPIFAFIDYHDKQFNDKLGEFDDRTLNKNINIGVMRMHGKLPAKILAEYFATIAGRGMERKVIPIENLDTSPKYKAVDNVIKKLEGIKSKNDWLENQKEMIELMSNLPFSPNTNNRLAQRAKSFWEVNRKGVNLARQLIHQIQSAMSEESPVFKESFDDVAAQYVTSFTYDKTDLLIDLQEIA
jgi:hypothetical protein